MSTTIIRDLQCMRCGSRFALLNARFGPDFKRICRRCAKEIMLAVLEEVIDNTHPNHETEDRS